MCPESGSENGSLRSRSEEGWVDRSYLYADTGQLASIGTPTTQFSQRWQNEEIKSDESRSGIAGKGKDRRMSASGDVLVRNRGKRCWFTRFHLDSPKVDCSFEVALDDWFQQVRWTHGCPTGRQDQIRNVETLLNLRDVILDTRQWRTK